MICWTLSSKRHAVFPPTALLRAAIEGQIHNPHWPYTNASRSEGGRAIVANTILTAHR